MFVPMLSFIEQGALYARIISDANESAVTAADDEAAAYAKLGPGPAQAGNSNSTNANYPPSVWSLSVDAFICPSEASRKARPKQPASGAQVLGRTNYAVCAGDWADSSERAAKNMRGFACFFQFSSDTNVSPHRRFNSEIHGTVRTFGSLADGTSNTIVLSEVCIADGDGIMLTTGTYAPSNSAVDNTVNNSNPGACMGFKGTDGQYNDDGTNTYEMKGRRWGHSYPTYASFATIYPPNGPSCAGGTADSARVANSASSQHTGGVNVCLGDGSVRFVSETVDTGNLTNATNPGKLKDSGQSDFGVWGGMGSIDGGEGISL